jgi:hypothetical protein
MIHYTLNLYIRKGNYDRHIGITPIYKVVALPVRHPRTDRGIGTILACFARHWCVICFYNLRRGPSKISPTSINPTQTERYDHE